MSLHINFCGTSFSTPVLVASGTFGYGHEVSNLVDVNKLGGIVTKSVTLNPREGNPPPRIFETPSGMLNSIGLANVGVEAFCSVKIPFLDKLNTNVIINIAGSTQDEYIKTLERIEANGGNHIGYEINISCPNVKEGGMAFGVHNHVTESLTKELRKRTNRLLILKLSPNVTNIQDIAQSAEQGGADAVSAINTVVGMSININTRKPNLHTNAGGLSGPAIHPIAVANVFKIYQVVKIPIIGIGGVSNANDIIELMLAGASLVQIGTSNFANSNLGVEVCKDLTQYCQQKNIGNISDIVGKVNTY